MCEDLEVMYGACIKTGSDLCDRMKTWKWSIGMSVWVYEDLEEVYV